MIQYQKIDVSEGIDVSKTSASKEDEPCHHRFLKGAVFKFKKHVCNGCYNLLTMGFPLKNIAILSAKGHYFTCILMKTTKNEALEKLNNSLTRDRGIL